MCIQDIEKVSSTVVVKQDMIIPAKYQLSYQVANPLNQ